MKMLRRQNFQNSTLYKTVNQQINAQHVNKFSCPCNLLIMHIADLRYLRDEKLSLLHSE